MASWSGPCSSSIRRRARLTSLRNSGRYAGQTCQHFLHISGWYEHGPHTHNWLREEEQFLQHLEVMLGEGVERPGWDLEGRFTPSSVQLYFENKAEELVKVTMMSQSTTLSDSTLLVNIVTLLFCIRWTMRQHWVKLFPKKAFCSRGEPLPL